jgi:hypothetical protein
METRMNRYLNVGLSCAAAALIGLTSISVAAQQPTRGGRGGRAGTPPATQGGASSTPSTQGDRIGTNTPGTPPPMPNVVGVLGTVHLARAVKADGQPLAAGTYQMRVTDQQASTAAPGQTPQYEHWAEFLQGGQVKGREVVTIVTPDAANQVMKESFPPAGGYKAEVLKGGDYYRVWFNKNGTQYLVHFNI